MVLKKYKIENVAPKVSVIVVSYFTGPLLDRAIQSILEQDVSFELIVVDNGNAGSVTATLYDLARKDGRVRICSGHGNIGFAGGCNLGARHASGELLFFLNPDTQLPPYALRDLRREGKTVNIRGYLAQNSSIPTAANSVVLDVTF
jgi:GT2 family glycosyltransferase